MKQYKIVEKKNVWYLISILAIFIGFFAMTSRFIQDKSLDNILNYGIDFKGGTSFILTFDKLDTEPTPLPKDTSISFITNLRESLASFGLNKSRIQITQKKEVLIKTLGLKDDKSQELLDHLSQDFGNIHILEIDLIGPTIGNELKSKSLLIILVVSLSLLAYISWRFQFVYGIAALIALLHDALIVISFAALFELEINTAFVAALLTILGYSINDTIVIFDRVRENLTHIQEDLDISVTLNSSLIQTLSRTINTSLTTIIVISTLIFFGGATIKEFCITLLVGIVSGTYSSVFIATPILSSLLKKNATKIND